MQVIVIIPVYKQQPDEFESVGLQQCAKVLKDYPVALVCPQGFDASAYLSVFGSRLQLYFFSPFYFKNLRGYNHLMTSEKFYQTFLDYEYMLIHHTDAYVFRDELLYWCSQGYDYIGAPMYEYDGSIRPQKYIGVGNGGLSLHRVSAAVKVLSSWKIVYPLKDLWSWYGKYNWKGRLRYLGYFLTRLSSYGRWSHSGFNHLRINEDIFWGVYVPQAFDWFSVAPFDQAYKFSMEYNCEKLLALNHYQLPFGCHQWYKGEFLAFWQDKILSHSQSSLLHQSNS